MSRDQGRMWVRRDFEPVFDRLGWRSCRDVMSASQPTLVRQLPDRSNHVIDLPAADGTAATRLHLKRHRSQRTRRPAFDHSPLKADVAAGVHEADAVGACQRAGVPTMAVVAAGQQAGDRGRRADSFFISENLRGALSAEDYWPRHLAGADANRRAAFLAALAKAAADLHRAGLFHRDLYWCHFMVTPPADPDAPPAVHFIDLQRLHRPLLRGFARLKDLAQFVVSAPRGQGAPTADELRSWYACYRGALRLSVPQRLAFESIRLRAAFYRIKGMRP